MPTFALSPQERRLASFCRFFAAVYLLIALLVAAVPRFVYVIASLGQPSDLSPETRFWSLLAAALEVASAVACAVVAGDPRGRRHALLPVVAAKLTTPPDVTCALGGCTAMETARSADCAPVLPPQAPRIHAMAAAKRDGA